MNLNATVVLQAHEAEQVRSIVEHLASRKSNDIIAASIRTKFHIERNNGTKNTYKGVHREFQQWCDQKYNGDMNAGIVSARTSGRQTVQKAQTWHRIPDY